MPSAIVTKLTLKRMKGVTSMESREDHVEQESEAHIWARITALIIVAAAIAGTMILALIGENSK